MPNVPIPVTMGRSRRIRVGAIALLGVTLLAACGDGDGPEGGGGPAVIETRDAAVLVAAPADGGSDAAIAGAVSIVDGCLGIGDNVAVWPSGTQVIEPEGPVIDVPNLGTITIGDNVEGAGGYMPAKTFDDAWSPSVPDSCVGAGLVVYRPE